MVKPPEGKRPLGRLRSRWKNNIKMDLQEVGRESMDWINVAQDSDRWRALLNAVMNPRALQNAGILWLAETRLPSQGLCSME